jgi:F-type H+-transporting ATPase subunit delta
MTELASRNESWAEAFFQIARAEGNLAEVEDELFRFSTALEGNEQLRSTLSDPHIPAERRQQIVHDLLSGKASSTTEALIAALVGVGRIDDLDRIVQKLSDRSNESSGSVLAEVRSAVPLNADQQQRLAAAITRQTGREVTLRTIVDPNVVGGIVTQIGDSVIDGSLRTRLNQLREAL